MLIENLRPSAIYCAGKLFYPGINKLSEDEKKDFEQGGYWSSFLELQDRGVIRVEQSEKPTSALVAKTFDVELLESWLDDAPKPLLSAIRKQIAMMKEVPEGAVTITVQ